jgi:signal recognition particle subunit SEC65
MAKREKKPKVYRIKLYDTLEEELKAIREEAKIKEEMHRNWDNPEYWKKVYERSIGEPFPYPDETDAKKVQEVLEKRLEEKYRKMGLID